MNFYKSSSKGRYWADCWMFLSKWMKSPRSLASVVPSSAALGQAMAQTIDGRRGKILELGPGTGAITEHLIREVGFERLVVLEKDQDMAKKLRARWPDLHVIQGDAQDMVALWPFSSPPAMVVSGLGLKILPVTVVSNILSALSYGWGKPLPWSQFSYGVKSPLMKTMAASMGWKMRKEATVLANLPVARVWMFTPF